MVLRPYQTLILFEPMSNNVVANVPATTIPVTRLRFKTISNITYSRFELLINLTRSPRCPTSELPTTPYGIPEWLALRPRLRG